MTPTGTGGRCDRRPDLAVGGIGTGCCRGLARNPRAGPASGLGKAGGFTVKNGPNAGAASASSYRKKATALLDHATNQQENVYEYRQKLAELETRRARDAADIASLQQQLRTTATQRAQAAADAAAARDLADHYQRLAAHLADGAGVVGELVGLVERRDAQVILLKEQVITEQKLLGELLGLND